MNSCTKVALGNNIKRMAENGTIKAALICMRKHSTSVSYELARVGIAKPVSCHQCAIMVNRAKRRRKRAKLQ